MYERVKVQASRIVDDVETFADSYSVYEFNVFDEEMVQLQYSEVYDEKFPYRLYNNQDFLKYNNKRTRKVTLRDFTSMVGAMKSVALYGADGNKITETVNHYLHDNVDLAMGENPTDATGYPGMLRSMFNGQGIIQETFTDSRFVKLTEIDNKFSLVGLITKREQYPVVSIGQTTTNFKTGIQNSSSTIAFDYYSGQPVKTVSADGHGNLFMSETVPAYRKYPAIGQGSKQGMNMLTQEAATYVYSIDANRNILGLVSGAAQTWSNQTPVIAPGQDKSSAQTQSSIWRKDARYQFVGTPTEAVSGNGYSLSGNHIFDAWQPGSTVPEGWQQLGKVTLYDVQSNPIEGSDLNNIYSAVKMTPDQSKVSAIAANARHEEFAYSGAEDGLQGLSLGNQLRIESGSGAHITNEAYHTGSHSLATTSTGFVFNNYLPSYKRYTVSVWSSQPDAQLKWLHMGQPIDLSPVVRKAGDWYLITASFTATGNNVYVWCQRNSSTQGTAEVFFDDFRIAPSNATMKSFVYQPDDLLTYILDDNNLYTRFIYDKLGRLEEVKRESFQFGVSRVSKNTTHYAKQN
jgi:hypothetical protein